MKKTIKIFAMLSALFIALAILPNKAMAQDTNSPPPQQDPNAPPSQQDPNNPPPQEEEPQSGDYQEFYSQLAPYGQWVDEPTYGYVFVPTAGPGFYPYRSRGHWVYTDFGWTWASNYPFGWATFHYGRWNFDNTYGWFWIPGSVWAPAWVDWCSSGEYYGWAPLGYGMRFGVRYDFPEDHWCFLRGDYMGREDMYHYYEPRGHNREFVRNVVIINNTYEDHDRHRTYYAGPRVGEVQKRTGTPIRAVSVHESNTPGQRVDGNQMTIYRPQLKEIPKGNPKPAPANHQPINKVQPLAQRRAAYNQAHPTNNTSPQRPNNQPQQRQAAPQQPQRQVQQPQRQAPQQPQRQAPQQPQRQAPQPQRQAPQQQHQAPRQAPQQHQAPVRQAPQPQREAPRQEEPHNNERGR